MGDKLGKGGGVVNRWGGEEAWDAHAQLGLKDWEFVSSFELIFVATSVPRQKEHSSARTS